MFIVEQKFTDGWSTIGQFESRPLAMKSLHGYTRLQQKGSKTYVHFEDGEQYRLYRS